jgi:hypothetical protein
MSCRCCRKNSFDRIASLAFYAALGLHKLADVAHGNYSGVAHPDIISFTPPLLPAAVLHKCPAWNCPPRRVSESSR